MKYFRVQFVSQKTMHPLGLVCMEHTVSAETKAAAKLESMALLRAEDDANCMYYKSPRLEDITAERYAEMNSSDATDLLAMPEDEPELHGAYLLLRDELNSVLSVRDATLSADDVRKEALSLYQMGKPSNEPAVDSFALSTKSVDKCADNGVAASDEPQTAANVIALVKKQSDFDVRSTKFWQQHPPIAGKVLGGGGLTPDKLNAIFDGIQPGESRVFTGLPNETYHAAADIPPCWSRCAFRKNTSAPRW